MNTTYRPDIDGLRAMAILAVIVYHAFPLWLPGGFIGVDIFFVISGFLISSLIFTQLNHDRFSFLTFYGRRLKRIFPALLLVLISCLVFGWFALFGDEYKALGKHIAGGAGFISNFLFWKESGYFDSAAATKPLLHLWSLGIEEQFYITWPLLLWIAWKQRLDWLYIIVLIIIISFTLNLRGIPKHTVATFYSPQTRFWELLLGSLLAYAHLHTRLWQQYIQSLTRRLPNASSILGVTLIAIGLVCITSDTHFPGLWALLPTLGTVCIIAAGPQAFLNRVILSHRVLVGIGLISYPLYLWHWPLLAFARIVESDTPPPFIRGAALLLSFALSCLTYYLIEKPIRFGPHGKIKALALLALMVMVGGTGYDVYMQDGFALRRSDIMTSELQARDIYFAEKTRSSDGSCESRLRFKTNTTNIVCIANAADPDIMIVGDSHAMALDGAAYLHRVNAKTLLIAQVGCPPFLNVTRTDANGDNVVECSQLYADSFAAIKNLPSIKTIIIETIGPQYFGRLFSIDNPNNASGLLLRRTGATMKEETSESVFYKGYSEYVSKLIATGKKVIFVIDVPEMGMDPHACLSKRPFEITDKVVSSCSTDRALVIKRQATYRQIVARIKADNPQLIVFDSHPVFCDDSACSGKLGEHILYFDPNHISVLGSELLLNAIIKADISSNPTM